MALDFSASIDRNVLRLKQEINDKVYKISIELFLAVVAKTPSPAFPGKHAKGLLANQWYPAVGGEFSTERGTDTSRNGAASKSRIVALRGGNEFLGQNGKLTLANNLEYAYRAEVLGWAKTGPYAMVRLALQEIAAKYK